MPPILGIKSENHTQNRQVKYKPWLMLLPIKDWMEMYEFRLKFHWSLLVGVEFMILEYWSL